MNPRTALLVATLLLLAGCESGDGGSGFGNGGGGAGMNMQEAADRADEILDSTFSRIKPEVRWVHGESTEGSCDVSRRRAVVTVISAARRGSFLGVVERAWKGSGYRRLGVNANSESPATYFETPDGFRVRLLIGGGGQAFFEVATPCVDESPVAPPALAAGEEGHGGEPVPAPSVRSPFWSAGAP